jgi:hypothetical protein
VDYRRLTCADPLTLTRNVLIYDITDVPSAPETVSITLLESSDSLPRKDGARFRWIHVPINDTEFVKVTHR